MSDEMRKSFEEWAKSLPELEPCDFCGRLVLAGGWCCEEAKKNGSTKKEKTDVLPE